MLTAAVSPARAAEWGTIVAGVSTLDSVRAQYGGPTKTETQKVDNYDTSTWVYEGAQAPGGLIRMVVDFGILQAGGYRRDVVRSFKLGPNPASSIADVIAVGCTGSVGQQGGARFSSTRGPCRDFGKDGGPALPLVFTPPQPPIQRSRSPLTKPRQECRCQSGRLFASRRFVCRYPAGARSPRVRTPRTSSARTSRPRRLR